MGFNKPIVEEDIYNCSNGLRSKENSERFNQIWNEELMEEKPRLVKSIVKFCALKIFLIGIPVSVLELLCK